MRLVQYKDLTISTAEATIVACSLREIETIIRWVGPTVRSAGFFFYGSNMCGDWICVPYTG